METEEILKCKADGTAVKRYLLFSTIFQIDNTILHQGHKMLSEHGNKSNLLKSMKFREMFVLLLTIWNQKVDVFTIYRELSSMWMLVMLQSLVLVSKIAHAIQELSRRTIVEYFSEISSISLFSATYYENLNKRRLDYRWKHYRNIIFKSVDYFQW